MPTYQQFNPTPTVKDMLNKRPQFRYYITVLDSPQNQYYSYNPTGISGAINNVDITIDLSNQTFQLDCAKEGYNPHKGTYYTSKSNSYNGLNLINDYVRQALDNWECYYLS